MAENLLTYLLLAAFAGALGGVHVPINGALGQRIGSTLIATFTFYGVAFLLIAVVAFAAGNHQAFRALGQTPPWYYLLPGLISVIVVGSSTFLMPRLGAVNVFVVFVSAQLLVRTLISHFGWLESPVDPVNASKILGGIFLIAGALLVVRS